MESILKIVPLSEELVDDVVAIENLSYKSPWKKDFFLNELKNKEVAYMFVLLFNDKVIGYAGFWISYEYATITKVTIHPSLRGKGLSKILFKDLLTRIEELGAECISLEVRENNIVAQNLYSSFGFSKQGIRKKYYDDGDNAIVMLKELNGGSGYEETYIGNRE